MVSLLIIGRRNRYIMVSLLIDRISELFSCIIVCLLIDLTLGLLRNYMFSDWFECWDCYIMVYVLTDWTSPCFSSNWLYVRLNCYIMVSLLIGWILGLLHICQRLFQSVRRHPASSDWLNWIMWHTVFYWLVRYCHVTIFDNFWLIGRGAQGTPDFANLSSDWLGIATWHNLISLDWSDRNTCDDCESQARWGDIYIAWRSTIRQYGLDMASGRREDG